MPNATQPPQTDSLSLVAEKTSAPVVFLLAKFGDLAVYALVDSGAMHNFLAASLLPKLRDSPSLVLIVPCQLQVSLVEGVCAAQLATLALEVMDDQGVIVPDMLGMGFYILDMLPALAVLGMPFL